MASILGSVASALTRIALWLKSQGDPFVKIQWVLFQVFHLFMMGLAMYEVIKKLL